jgi:hypothetical protein
MATRHDISARQGKTLYIEGEATPVSNLTAAQLRAKTLKATLLGTSTVFLCAWTGDDATKATFAISISDAIMATLDSSRSYEYNLDAYDATNNYEIAYGTVTVRRGQNVR